MFNCWGKGNSDLLMSVPFPDVDAGQVGHNERPQLLVSGHLTEKKERETILSHLGLTQPKDLYTKLFPFEMSKTVYIYILCFQETIQTHFKGSKWKTITVWISPVEQQWTEPQRYPCSSLRYSRGPGRETEETDVNGSYYVGQMHLVNSEQFYFTQQPRPINETINGKQREMFKQHISSILPHTSMQRERWLLTSDKGYNIICWCHSCI